MTLRSGRLPVVGTCVVIGGGADGAFYVRQLARARAAGRLDWQRVHVVDRDPHCAVSRLPPDPRVKVWGATWDEWLDGQLEGLTPQDYLVPYHWAPHLLLDWLAGQVRHAGGHAERVPLVAGAPAVPFDRATAAGDRAVSYATWACPPRCIEPDLCPHTRGPRDWSLIDALLAGALNDASEERIVWRCLHLAYGVAGIPVGELLRARDRVLATLDRGPRRYLVATASHCHGLAAGLAVSPGAP